MGRMGPWTLAAGLAVFALARRSEAALLPQPTVTGTAIVAVASGTSAHDLQPSSWSSLATTNVAAGPRWLVFTTPAAAEAVLIPTCAGRKQVLVDDADMHVAPGPPGVIDLPGDGREHRVSIVLDVSGYEHRAACGAPPVTGARATTHEGLVPLDFASPHASHGGGHAVVYVPPGHDPHRPATLLVGLHPWNGGIWTYAAYAALLEEAARADVVLLFPSGLGNALYTADAEDEVLRALAALCAELRVDPDRITLWGASMGGAGATTIGFHHPDLFAGVVSLFGDSRYDLGTYVRGILRDGAGAHRVNAFDIVDNARSLPVWLIHGTDDHVSPLAQSAVLDRALRAKGFTTAFDRVPGAGHEGRVVTQYAAGIVARARLARRVSAPARVSYWSVRPGDIEVYGIQIERTRPTGDAFFDIARDGDSVHLLHAEGVRALRLPRGAFGLAPTATPAIICDDPSAREVSVVWDAVAP